MSIDLPEPFLLINKWILKQSTWSTLFMKSDYTGGPKFQKWPCQIACPAIRYPLPKSWTKRVGTPGPGPSKSNNKVDLTYILSIFILEPTWPVCKWAVLPLNHLIFTILPTTSLSIHAIRGWRAWRLPQSLRCQVRFQSHGCQIWMCFCFAEIEAIGVVHLQSAGLRFLRPWTFQSQWCLSSSLYVFDYLYQRYAWQNCSQLPA